MARIFDVMKLSTMLSSTDGLYALSTLATAASVLALVAYNYWKRSEAGETSSANETVANETSPTEDKDASKDEPVPTSDMGKKKPRLFTRPTTAIGSKTADINGGKIRVNKAARLKREKFKRKKANSLSKLLSSMERSATLTTRPFERQQSQSTGSINSSADERQSSLSAVCPTVADLRAGGPVRRASESAGQQQQQQEPLVDVPPVTAFQQAVQYEKAQWTAEEREMEAQVRREQLEAIMRLMKQSEDDKDEEDCQHTLEQQMKLYAL